MIIEGLTEHQVELLNEMWACDTLEDYEAFYELLSEEDQQQADLLQRLVIMTALDDDMAEQTSFPEAQKLLDQFRI